MASKVATRINYNQIEKDRRINLQLYNQILRTDSVKRQLEKQQRVRQMSGARNQNIRQHSYKQDQSQQMQAYYLYQKQLEKERMYQQRLQQNCQKLHKNEHFYNQVYAEQKSSPQRNFAIRLEKVRTNDENPLFHSKQNRNQNQNQPQQEGDGDEQFTNYFDSQQLVYRNSSLREKNHLIDSNQKNNNNSVISHDYQEVPGDYDNHKISINEIDIKVGAQAKYFDILGKCELCGKVYGDLVCQCMISTEQDQKVLDQIDQENSFNDETLEDCEVDVQASSPEIKIQNFTCKFQPSK